MAQFAIKGHATRGKEVIQMLEMLGGVNVFKIEGAETQGFYYIFKDNNKIYYCWSTNAENVIVYTLEEFEEKFPYKVGDKVLAYVNNCIAQFTIQDIRWNYELNKVEYKICSSWLDASLMQYYKEEKTFPPYMDYDITITNEEAVKNVIQIPEFPKTINLTQSNVNEIEVILGNYEFILKDGKTYFVKNQPKYPKDLDECYSVLRIPGEERYVEIDNPVFSNKSIRSFIELLICRNAYWKIAGEELGLDKPWEPDWNDCAQRKFGLYTLENEIRCINLQVLKNIILVFPTEEIRDTFYENFKDLINQCKELL